MKQKRLAKKTVLWFLGFAMFLTTLNMPALTIKVKAEDTKDNIAWTEVSSAEQLKSAFNKTGDVYIKMTQDIKLDKLIEVNAGGTYKLDLNGKKLSCTVTDDANYPQIFRIQDSKMQVVNYGSSTEILCEKKNENHDPVVCFRPLGNSELTLGDDASHKIKCLAESVDGSNYCVVINNNAQSKVTIYDCMQCGDSDETGRIWIESGNAMLNILGGEYYGRLLLTVPSCYINHAVFYSALSLKDMDEPSIDSDAIIYEKNVKQENFADFSSMVEVVVPKLKLYNSPWFAEIIADVEYKGMASDILKLKKVIYVYDDTKKLVNKTEVPASSVALDSYKNIGHRENIFEYGKTYTVKVDFINESDEIVRTINTSAKCDVAVAEGKCGPVSWKLFANGDFVMSGNGNMTNTSTPALSDSDRYRIKRIIVENGVKNIAAGVFGNLPNLQEFVIPESVTSIASNALGTIPNDAVVKSKCDNAVAINYAKTTGMKQAYIHSNISMMPKVEATCSSYGVKAYYKCSCGKSYEDSACAKEITDLAAWKSGVGRVAKKDHTLTTKTTKATLTANGKKESICTVCGKVTKTVTIYLPKTIKLSATKYSYDGKVKKPSVTIKDSKGNAISGTNYTVTYPSGRKNVGKYTVKVTFKGNYSGTKNLTFTINPTKTSISTVTAGSKSFTVKWAKKTTQVTGYEIQYSASSTFAKGNKTVKVTSAKTVSKTIGKLTGGKKYYVRVRSYKTVSGKNYYSDWSAKKSVTTKK